MPVSPRDFALWSDLTGNPYPRTPAEQMALAPEVYSFTRNLGRQGGPTMSPLRRAVDVIGKTALAAGALAGAAYLGDQYIRSQEGGTQGTQDGSGIAGTTPPIAPSSPSGPSAPSASTSQIIEALGRTRAKGSTGIAASRLVPPSMSAGDIEKAYESSEGYRPYSTGQTFPSVTARAEALISSLERGGAGYQKLEVDNEPGLAPSVVAEPHHAVSPTVAASGDITPPTTSDQYLQDVVPNQTVVAQQIRGTSPIKPTVVASEMKPATQSEVITTKQQFTPGSEIEQIGSSDVERQKAEAFRKSAAYSVMQKQYPELQPISSSTEPASAAPESLTNVQPSPQIRVAREIKAPVESPIASMAKPAQAPVTASVAPAAPSGASPTEIRELDTLLSRSLARHTPEQRATIRDQMLAEKYGGGGAKPVVTPPQPTPVRVAREAAATPIEMPSSASGPSPESVRFAREAARGMSRVGLMAQREAGRADVASRAQFGSEITTEPAGEVRELADPAVLRSMLQRQPSIATPRYF